MVPLFTPARSASSSIVQRRLPRAVLRSSCFTATDCCLTTTVVSSEKGASRQLFLRGRQLVAAMQLRTGRMRGMDYRRVREALKALRFEKKLGVPDLAQDAGLAKTTLYRLEDVDDDPAREVDLVTLEKLVVAMGLTLSEFFAKIESGVDLNQGHEGVTTLPSLIPPSTGAADARSPVPRPASDLRDIIETNSAALIRLARAIDQLGELPALRGTGEPAPSPRAEKTARPVRHRKPRSA